MILYSRQAMMINLQKIDEMVESYKGLTSVELDAEHMHFKAFSSNTFAWQNQYGMNYTF